MIDNELDIHVGIPLSKEQVKEVMDLYTVYTIDYPKWRSGQAFFNALHTVFPRAADEIRGTTYDCFYKNDFAHTLNYIVYG